MKSKRHPRAPRVEVRVTQELIDQSVLRSSSHCMIAEAVKAAYPSAAVVSVDVQTIRFSDVEKRRRFVYLTPRIAQIPLVRFDQGVKPEPFSFVLVRGSVHTSGHRQKSTVRKTPDHLEKMKKTNPILGKPIIRDEGTSVPSVVGGRAPPPSQMLDPKTNKLVPYSKRRAFGIRAMGVLKDELPGSDT